jgi:hypothetical protein
VGEAQRTATFEDEAKFWARRFFMLRRFLRMATSVSCQDAKEKQCSRGSTLHNFPRYTPAGELQGED